MRTRHTVVIIRWRFWRKRVKRSLHANPERVKRTHNKNRGQQIKHPFHLPPPQYRTVSDIFMTWETFRCPCRTVVIFYSLKITSRMRQNLLETRVDIKAWTVRQELWKRREGKTKNVLYPPSHWPAGRSPGSNNAFHPDGRFVHHWNNRIVVPTHCSVGFYNLLSPDHSFVHR